jgi:hypothetical protein
MNITEPTTAAPVSGIGEHSAAFAESEACPRNCPKPKRQPSEARLRANRENAKNSRGPISEEGKKRSSLNATRHGLLAQTLHLPEEEMAAYHDFTASFVQGMPPLGVVETQLAHVCADPSAQALGAVVRPKPTPSRSQKPARRPPDTQHNPQLSSQTWHQAPHVYPCA